MSLELLYHARIDAFAAHEGDLISEIALALAMAYHPRLGSSAKLGTLPPEIVQTFLAPRMPWTYPSIPLTQGVRIELDQQRPEHHASFRGITSASLLSGREQCLVLQSCECTDTDAFSSFDPKKSM